MHETKEAGNLDAWVRAERQRMLEREQIAVCELCVPLRRGCFRQRAMQITACRVNGMAHWNGKYPPHQRQGQLRGGGAGGQHAQGAPALLDLKLQSV